MNTVYIRKIGTYAAAPVAIFSLMLAVAAPVYAHGGEKHRGKAVEGTILSVSNTGFVLKSETGKKEVIINEKTLLEKNGHEATREEVTFEAGQKTQVFGTKLPGAKIVATEIVVQSSSRGHEQHQEMKEMDHQMHGKNHDKMHGAGHDMHGH